jgi:hypothetical protein
MEDRKRIDIYNYDPGAERHSEKTPVREAPGTRFTSVEGDDHENPTTGSAMIYYPTQGGVT